MKFIIKSFLVALAYFSPIQTLFNLIFVLVLIDFITGVWSAIIKNGVWKQYCVHIPFKKDPFCFRLPLAGLNSRTMKRSVIKILCYNIAILVTFLIENIIFGSGIVITKWVTGFISLVEVASIFENLTKISGNPLFNKIYDTLSTYFNRNKNIINQIDGTNKDSDNQTNI